MAEINIDRIGGTGGAPTPLPLGNLKVDNPLSTALQIVKDTGGNASALYISTIDVTNFGGGAIASNTAFGINALIANTTGSANIAIGQNALLTNTTAGSNTAIGVSSMRINLTGGSNTALGAESLRFNVNGNNNTAIGRNALFDVQTGSDNTAIGYNTGRGITTGSNNTILGANVTGLSATLANNIIIADGSGNQRINVDSSGKVGIGTNAPTYSVDIIKATTGTVSLNIESTFANANSMLRISDGNARNSILQRRGDLPTGQLRILMNGATKFIFTDDGKFGITQANTPTAQFQILGSGTTSATTALLVQNSAGANLLSVLDNGNVGIGTNSPTSTLYINGLISAGVTNGINIQGPNSNSRIYLNDNQGSEISYQNLGYSVGVGVNQIGGNTTISDRVFRNGVVSLNARLGIKGSGSTSATTALLVQDSASSANLTVKDNGEIVVGAADSGFKYRSGVGLDLGQVTSSGGGGWIVQMWDDSYSKRYAVFTANGVQFGDNLAGLTNTSAQLSADSTTKGFLPPRMTTTQKNAIATPAAGLMVYDTNLNKLCVYTTAWEIITSA
jgi:hypothetical protein